MKIETDKLLDCSTKSPTLSWNSTIEKACDEFTNVSNSNDSLHQEIPSFHPTLFETNEVLAIIYITLLGVALIIGFFGNSIILASVCLPGNICRIGKEFIFNLALADICVTGVADPVCIVGVLKGESFFNDNPIFCETVAAMCLTACFCAFISLSMATFNRYIYICHNDWYDRIYSTASCVAMCIMCWIIAFLCEFPNFVGWGGHTFDKKNHQCIWDRRASISYSMFLALGLIGAPLFGMGVCYALIFSRIWKSKKSVYKLDYEDPYRMVKAWKETVRSSRTLFILFSAFVVCWTPYAVVIMIDSNDNLPMEYIDGCVCWMSVPPFYVDDCIYRIHLLVTLLAHLHSTINIIVYMTCSKRFRRGIFRYLGCYCSKTPSSDSKTINSDVRIRNQRNELPNIYTLSRKIDHKM